MFVPILSSTLLAVVLAATPEAKAGPHRPQAKAPKKSDDPAATLLDRVQRYYDSTKDFTADFLQTYTRTALSRTTESSGTVMIKKPGMVRWSYEKPATKLFVADGHQLFIYEPEEEQVIIDPHFDTQELKTSISFLWGDGRLDEAFTASIGDPAKYGAPQGAAVLELVPKKDATYTKLVLILDPKTSQVTESILFETSGNTNDFKFKNARMNTNLKRDLFTFTPPPNVEIVRRP